MAQPILCPICDEDLGYREEDLPEKCPICDSRKHEILQEIRELKNSQKSSSAFLVEGQVKPSASAEVKPKPQVSSGVSEYYFPSPTARRSPKETRVVRPKQTPVSSIPRQVPKETRVVRPKQTPVSSIPKQKPVSNLVAKPNLKQPPKEKVKANRLSEDVIFESSNEDVIFEDLAPASSLKKAFKPRGPRKTGASQLETLPEEDKGFPSGDYLVLYNDERKAIAYFRLNDAGSVILGRSSERSAPNDIDLTMVWREYYREQAPSTEEFQNKMALLKGISRKHALVRYDQEKQSYVFFHLSDKNYSIVRTSQGEKWERSPLNRDLMLLESNALISMGNQKNFIQLRFKKIV